MLLHGGKSLLYIQCLGRFSVSSWILRSGFSSNIPCKKSKLAPLQERKMIDRFRLLAKGGDGGNGCTSFRRSRHDRRGRPDGGNGGRGGDVILECSPSIWDFSSLQHHTNAKKGGHGSSKNMIGSRGVDKVVQVPIGTVIHLVEGEIPSVVEKSSSEGLDPWEIPGSLDDSSESSDQSGIMALKSKNSRDAPASHIRNKSRASIAAQLQFKASFHPQITLSSNKRSGEVEASNSWKKESNTVDEGLHGDHDSSEEMCEEEFELNANVLQNVAELTEPGQRIVIAQGGNGGLGNVFAGNASKKTHTDTNTKVSDDDEDDDNHVHLSAGMPGSEVVIVLELKSIADVGLVGMPNAVADIPGIIKGAHQNRGLGHAFLRHIERTKVLAYVVDLAAAIDGRKGLPPWKQLEELILELEFYQKGMSDRPSLVVANKIDEEGAKEVYEELKKRVLGVPIFPVCAVLEEGIPELRDGLRLLVNGEETHKLKLGEVITD